MPDRRVHPEAMPSRAQVSLQKLREAKDADGRLRLHQHQLQQGLKLRRRGRGVDAVFRGRSGSCWD